MYNGIKFTEESDIERIAEASFRILDECGVSVEHEKLAELICGYNPENIKLSDKRIYINAGFARDYFISFKNNKNSKNISRQPDISAAAEIYHGSYLDPYDGEFKEWSEERLSNYIKLAKKLPNIGSALMLGCSFNNIDNRKRPLIEKLYAFKYGLLNPASIWDISLCPAIYKIWEKYAEERALNIADVFCGTVYLISPLRIGYAESEQILWFKERGLKVGVGNMPSIGLSAPVTLAGGIALQIAEQLFLSIMRAALYGEKYLSLSGSVSVADMRTGAFRFGRPERLLMNGAIADIACYYDIEFWGSGGLSDAKVPSYEAGVQKISAALSSLMKGQSCYIAAGLLSVDEIYSPVQMVLDNEAVGYLRRIYQGFGVSKSDLALEAVKECIKEDLIFLGQTHTAENARSCLWEPSIFSRETFSAWCRDTDYDGAREKALEIMAGPALEPMISERCEQQILKIIDEYN